MKINISKLTSFQLKYLKFFYFKKILLEKGGRCLKCDLKNLCGNEILEFKCTCKSKFYYKLRDIFTKK
jgi:hypothetical protein